MPLVYHRRARSVDLALGPQGDGHEDHGAELMDFLPDHLRADLVLVREVRGQPLGECLKLEGRRRRSCGGPADSIGAEGAVEESEPVVSGVADAAGELAAAGRATAAGVAASTEFKPRWGSSQEYWRTMASTPPLRQSSIWTACARFRTISLVFSM